MNMKIYSFCDGPLGYMVMSQHLYGTNYFTVGQCVAEIDSSRFVGIPAYFVCDFLLILVGCFKY